MMPAYKYIKGTLKNFYPPKIGKSSCAFQIESKTENGKGTSFHFGTTKNQDWINYLSSLQIGAELEINGELSNWKKQVKNNNGGYDDALDENGKNIYEERWEVL